MSIIDRAIYKFFKTERTYSQTGEDRILSFVMGMFGKKNISYLDVGTNHPKMGNNTFLFYRQGGKGVCVEPNPELCREIKKRRPRDLCLNIGIGTNDGVSADFYIMSSHVLSTFSKDEAEELNAKGNYKIDKVLKMPLRNINSIIKEYFESPIDLVSIDVEGWNEEIVRSFDFRATRPFCFCVETITFSENLLGERLTGIFETFERNNYSVIAETPLNAIFLDNDQRKLVAR